MTKALMSPTANRRNGFLNDRNKLNNEVFSIMNLRSLY